MAEFWQTITALVDSGISAVTNLFNGLPEPIKAVLSGIWDTMKTVFSWSPLGLITNNFSEIMTFLTGLPATFSSLGEMTMDGLINGITSKIATLKETMYGMGSEVINSFKDMLGIASPSKVFAVMGDQTMQGLTVGLNRSQQSPINEVSKLGKQMAGTAFVLGISALPAAAMPDAARLIKSGELPAKTIQRHADGQLAPNATPAVDRLNAGTAFRHRQLQPPQAVHIDAGIHAPITIYATANMDPQDIARLVAIELDKRQRTQQARLRTSLKDLN
jgi:hypothetical protein